MIKKISIIVLLLLLYKPSAYASTELEISSNGTLLMEAETGQVLYENNAKERFYPASITKVLTAIVAIEENNLSDEVIIGDNVPNQIEPGSSSVYLVPGERLTIEELMYALLIESANDAAVAIAEHTSGSEAKFADLMNDKVEELGAADSNFVNASGLHHDNHYTTPHDMALIMREAIKHPELCKFMTTSNYTIDKTNKQDTRYLWAKNRLYKSETKEYYYKDLIASKTGYTSRAGNTLVSAAQRDGMELISVVLGGNGTSTYTDTIDMFEYGFENFTTSTLVNKDEFIEERKIEDASNPLQIVSRSTVKFVNKKDKPDEIQTALNIEENLRGSINKGDKIGTIEYTMGNATIGEVELIAANEVVSNRAVWINRVKENLIYIIPLAILLYIVLRIYVHIRNVRIRKRRISRKYGLHYKPYKRRRRFSSRNQYYKY